MIHRDLRNVLLSETGVLKISDFGLAKMAARIYCEDISHSQIPRTLATRKYRCAEWHRSAW